MRLIDADALLAKFNKKTYLWSALTDEKTSNEFALYCKVADTIEEMPSIGGWISVNDRMPPAGKVLLVARKYKEPGKKEIRYVETGELMDDCTWISDSDEYKINRKYHSQPYAWMLLPEPPKEEKQCRTGKE